MNKILVMDDTLYNSDLITISRMTLGSALTIVFLAPIVYFVLKEKLMRPKAIPFNAFPRDEWIEYIKLISLPISVRQMLVEHIAYADFSTLAELEFIAFYLPSDLRKEDKISRAESYATRRLKDMKEFQQNI